MKKPITPLIGIGVPSFGSVSLRWAKSYKSIQLPLGASCADIPVLNMPIAEARNEIVRQALANKVKYLFFLGDDVHVPPNAIISLLERQVDIVTGIYFTKTYPSEPYIWRGLMEGPYRDWKVGEFFELDMAGCDCLLVNTDVFRKMEEPWFSTDWVYDKDQKVPSPIATEDFYFYLKAKEVGYKVWCDARVLCNHEDRHTGNMFYIYEEMIQSDFKAKNPEGKKKLIADLGSGLFTKEFPANSEIRRYDIREDVNPDVRCDLRSIPEDAKTFDMVSSSQVLEHFDASEAQSLISEWTRILKIKGTLRIEVPNVVPAMKRISEGNALPIDWQVVNGGQQHEYDYHKTAYTPDRLKSLLESHPDLGVVDIAEEVQQSTVGGDYTNIIATVKKKKHSTPPALAEIWDAVPSAGELIIQGNNGNGRKNGNGEVEKVKPVKKIKDKVKT